VSGNRTRLRVVILFWACSLAFFWVAIYFRPEHRKRIFQFLRLYSKNATTSTN
jgi:hypothetical protein